VSSIKLRSGKELKEPRKNREEEQEIEVNRLEPSKEKDPTSNAKEMHEKKGIL